MKERRIDRGRYTEVYVEFDIPKNPKQAVLKCALDRIELNPGYSLFLVEAKFDSRENAKYFVAAQNQKEARRLFISFFSWEKPKIKKVDLFKNEDEVLKNFWKHPQIVL